MLLSLGEKLNAIESGGRQQTRPVLILRQLQISHSVTDVKEHDILLAHQSFHDGFQSFSRIYYFFSIYHYNQLYLV